MNRLILNQGSTFSVGANSSDTTIVGTSAGSEVITIGLGAKVVFDASFNKGGDVINLAGNASSYTAKQVGSSIVLTDSLGSSITIPVGIVGANISFADAAPRKLVYDTISRSIKLGNDVVDTTPDALSVGEAGPPAPAQTFSLTKSADAVDEDGSVLFTLATTGVAAGTEYTYTLSGVSAHDVVGGALTGVAKIGADGKAVIQVNLAEDGRTEGAETLTLNVAGKSGAVVINDTSKAPSVIPTYVMKASSANVDEGGTAVFTLETTNVAPGSQFNYLITGVNSADVVGGQLTGVATVGADGKALISVNLAADAKTEGQEILGVTVAGVSQEVIVNDTSLTPTITEASYALTGSTNVNEGGIATFNLKTTGIAAGSLVGYRIVGTGSAASISQTGTFTVDADGNAVVSVSVGNNNTIGDTGLLTVELLNGKSAPVVATVVDTTATTYAADAITAANSASGVLTINVAGTAAQSITLDTDQLTPTNGFVINSTSAAVNVTSSGGADKITLTGNGNNTVNTGNQGDTVLISGSGNNTVVTGAGDDNVTITGTGANRVEVGTGTDKVTGGAGNDTIVMGSGDMGDLDRIDGGDGIDTLVISGDNNEINQTNVKNVENIVLNGTTVTIEDLATLAKLQSIQGSSTTSAVTVNVATGDVVDLTGIALTTLKSITLSGTGTVTLKATAEDLQAVGAILKSGLTAVDLETDVAGFKALSNADTGINGSKTVTGTAQELLDNKAALTGATLKVSGTVGLTEAAALADAGLSATRTVAMSAADLLATLNYPDQVAALRATGVTIQVTGVATAEQAAKLVLANASGGYGEQIAAYDPANGVPGIAIEDTPANVAAYLTLNGGQTALLASGANAAQVASIKLLSGPAVSVADAKELALLASTKVSGSYAVSDNVAAIVGAISDGTLEGSLSKASSVALSSAGRVASTAADALELQVLGSKLVGGYDLALTSVTTLGTNELTAISGAKAASLAKSSGSFSVTELNTVLGQNSAATVDKLSDTAQNLSTLSSDKLDNVTGQIIVSTTASVQQASVFKDAIAALAAKAGATIDPANGINSYKIVGNKAAVLAESAAAVIKGSDGVSVSDALSLNEAKKLRDLVSASASDRLDASDTLTYSVSEDASVLAAALGATDNAATLLALAGATNVEATGTASVAQAKLLGAQYTPSGGSAAVQVDSYKISDTVATLFPGGTISGDIDATADAALARATKLSVQGEVTVAQMDRLQQVVTTASGATTIFDNVYAIKDTATAIATKALASGGAERPELVAATAITVDGPAAVADLAGLKALNTALATANKPAVAYSLVDTYANITGEGALSGTADVVASAKAASTITITGNNTDGDANQITLARLDTLATLAGTKSYVIQITDVANNIESLSAGILGSTVVTKLVLSDAPLSVANAKDTITKIGTAAAAKLSYNLVDDIDKLVATADASIVTAATNITANGNISASDAAKLLSLSGASGTVTYSLTGTYESLIAQAPAVADGATSINVTDASLSVDKYAELLRIAGLSTTVSTTVTPEAIVDTANAVSGASATVLAHTSGVTLTDKGSLTLSVAQAVALTNAGIDGYDVAEASAQPGDGAVAVQIADTAENLIAAKLAATAGSAREYVLGNGSYKVQAINTATLNASQAATLLSINDISATFDLADRSFNLVSGDESAGYTAVAAVGKAGKITVTATGADLTTAAEAKAIFTANSNVTFDVITTTADTIKSKTGAVYDYATTLATAGKVVVTSADTVVDMKAAVAAAGTTPIEYSLSDTADILAASANQTLVAGAKGLAFSSGVATAEEAAVLAKYAAKFSAGSFDVTDSAADLLTNLAAVKTAGGNVSVTADETATVQQFSTLKTELGSKLQTTDIGDTAAAIADFRIAGSTTGAGTYTFIGSKQVNAAQAANLDGQSVTGLIVVDSAANLLKLAADTQVDVYRVSDANVDMATAKLLYAAFGAKADYDVATTSERFLKAFDSNAVASGAQADTGAVNALKAADTLTVDGQAIIFGVKNSSLTANNRADHNTKIVGTVAELANIPSALKNAAGFVIVDTVAKLSDPANAGLIASSAGYVVRDAASTLSNVSASLLNSTQKALGVEVLGTASAQQISAIMELTNVDSYVVYALKDVASALVTSGTLNSYGGVRTGITVDGVANAVQAKALLAVNTLTHPVSVDVVTTVAAIDALTGSSFADDASALLGARSITIDSDPLTAGLQGVASASEAADLFAQSVDVNLKIEDTALNLKTAILNTGASGAKLSTLLGAEAVSVTDGANGTPATAAEAKQLAKVTITGGYAVSGTATELTTSTTVSLDDLRKATVVKVDTGTTATVEQAITLTNLVNFERGTTGADAGKSVLSISDSALNFAKFGSAALFSNLTAASTVVVDASTGYDTALSAAQAKALADLDAAAGAKFDTTPGSVKVSDNSAALLTAANAAALAKVGSISISDVVSVGTLNLIRALNDVSGGYGSQTYTYKLQGTVSELVSAGVPTVDGATSVRVTGTLTVDDMTLIEGRANNSGTVSTSTSYEAVSGTVTKLFGSASGTTLNATVAGKAESIDLVGLALIDQAKALLADKQFNGDYDIGDTAAALVSAINNADSLIVLQNADSVGLAAGVTASAEQAKMINANLANEAKLALADIAVTLNDSVYAATVQNADSIKVLAGEGNDSITAGITSAKITYVFDSLDDMATSVPEVDVINGKAGDVIDLTGILDWDTVTGANQGELKLDSNGTFVAGEYTVTRGYYSTADGSFVASASGTDTQLSIYTNNTAGADEIVYILGVSSLIADAPAGSDVNSFTFG